MAYKLNSFIVNNIQYPVASGDSASKFIVRWDNCDMHNGPGLNLIGQYDLYVNNWYQFIGDTGELLPDTTYSNWNIYIDNLIANYLTLVNANYFINNFQLNSNTGNIQKNFEPYTSGGSLTINTFIENTYVPNGFLFYFPGQGVYPINKWTIQANGNVGAICANHFDQYNENAAFECNIFGNLRGVDGIGTIINFGQKKYNGNITVSNKDYATYLSTRIYIDTGNWRNEIQLSFSDMGSYLYNSLYKWNIHWLN